MRGLLLLLLAGLSDGDIVFRETEPSTPILHSFSDAEKNCLVQDKVLHSDGQCYHLRQRGPCQEGEWLVLDKTQTQDTRLLACKPLPCNRPLRVFWPPDGKCHRMTEKNKLCPYTGNKLRSDSYGDGECSCEKKHVRLHSDVVRGSNPIIEWEGHCHALYQRGSCPARKVLMPESMEGFGVVGTCKDDPCHLENIRNSAPWFAKLAKDGPCYQLGTSGVCAANETFDVHPDVNIPRCFIPDDVNTLALWDSNMRCLGNVNNKTLECQEELKIKLQTMPFVVDATSPKRIIRRG